MPAFRLDNAFPIPSPAASPRLPRSSFVAPQRPPPPWESARSAQKGLHCLGGGWAAVLRPINEITQSSLFGAGMYPLLTLSINSFDSELIALTPRLKSSITVPCRSLQWGQNFYSGHCRALRYAQNLIKANSRNLSRF